jgi:hypothetical protein
MMRVEEFDVLTQQIGPLVEFAGQQNCPHETRIALREFTQEDRDTAKAPFDPLGNRYRMKRSVNLLKTKMIMNQVMTVIAKRSSQFRV